MLFAQSVDAEVSKQLENCHKTSPALSSFPFLLYRPAYLKKLCLDDTSL